ncbi:uncharacterized protein LOC144662529 [Oculina patagonica]
MRLREANNWITKHNERIKSTGTLRTKAQSQEKQHQAVKDAPKLTKDKDGAKPKQRKSKTKVHKGFVCRTWATNFLPMDVQKNEDDEFIPFFVRKYVDKSKSNFPDKGKQTSTPLEEENRKDSDITSTQTKPENTLSQNAAKELNKVEVHLEKPHLDEFNNRRKGGRIKTSSDNLQNLPRVPYEFICSCGQAITHQNKETNKSSTFSGTKHLRRQTSKNSKVRFSVALPIKQFPPINPLEEMKKTNFPARKKREILPTRRPHTVDTALLSKGIILVNGHHNLPPFTNACDGRRPTTSSLETPNKYRQISSRVTSEQDYDTGSKRFDDQVIESLSRNAGTTSSSPQCILNEEQNGCERRGRHRSLSEPRSISLSRNQNTLCRHSAGCFTENRRRVRTPPHSLNSEDGDSNTDSNDTGLGSEIEYLFDGLAKLDVYLQPRSTSLHEHSS